MNNFTYVELHIGYDIDHMAEVLRHVGFSCVRYGLNSVWYINADVDTTINKLEKMAISRCEFSILPDDPTVVKRKPETVRVKMKFKIFQGKEE